MNDDRITRITENEELLDRLNRAIGDYARACAALTGMATDVDRLAAYYESPLWKEDYDADERGLLPDGLRRGVLSQDAVYDALREYDDVMNKIKEDER